jgi:tetratricopeptide (TPR) repeat protein
MRAGKERTEDTMAHRPSTPSARVLLGALAALALLGLVELGLTLAGLPDPGLYAGDPSSVWWLRPGLDRQVPGPEPGSSFHVRTNALGLRGAPPPQQGPWTLALGCSTTFGWGVEAEQAWPARLAEGLGEPVVNGGQPGWSTHQAVAAAGRWLDLRPSRVVLAYIVRDAQLAPQADHQARPSPWIQRTHIARGLAALLSLTAAPPSSSGGVPRVPPERFVENLRRLVDMADGAEVLLLAFPQQRPSEDHLRALGQVGAPVFAPHQPHEDFFPSDPLHLTAQGHRVLAAALAERLASGFADPPLPRDGTGEDPIAQVDVGLALLVERRDAEAEAGLVAAIGGLAGSVDPDRVMARRRALDRLGRLYIEQGRHAEAEEVLVRALEGLAEDNRDAREPWGCPYQSLGVLYARMGQPGRALTQLYEAADIEQGNGRTQLDAALAALSAGDGASARQFLGRLLEPVTAADGSRIAHLPLQRAEIEALEGFALLLDRDLEGARARFDGAQGPGGASALGRAHVAIAMRDYPRAEAAIEAVLPQLDGAWVEHEGDALLLDPQRLCQRYLWEMAHLGLAWVHANQGRQREALAEYDAVLAKRPDHLLALLGRGNALTWLGRLGEARALFEGALERYPDNAFLLAELAVVQLQLDQPDQAEISLQASLAHADGHYTCPYEGLGILYLERGETERAAASFEKAIALNPDIEFRKYNGLARIRMAEGRLEQARALLEKSIANYPHDQEAPRLLRELESLAVQ